MKRNTLMKIGKVSVVGAYYGDNSVRDTLDLSWTEVQQDSWYKDEEVEEEIDKEDAIKLIEVLTKHFNL